MDRTASPRMLAENWRGPNRERKLEEYGRRIVDELAWVDEITGTCFACFDRFEVMVPVSMLYFVAAHFCEERERAKQAPPGAAFLLADDTNYRAMAARLCRQALTTTAADSQGFAADVRRALEPYNLCCLGDPGRSNMYPFTGTDGTLQSDKQTTLGH